MNPAPQWSQGHSHQPVLSTATQVQLLLDEFKRTGDSILLCATLLNAECGMLPPEVVMLTWRDIDFVEGTLLVPSSGSPGSRRVRMSARLRTELKEGRRRAPSDDPYVLFPFTARNEAAERIAHSLSRTCERLGLSSSFHSIRSALARVQ
jgi:integrase